MEMETAPTTTRQVVSLAQSIVTVNKSILISATIGVTIIIIYIELSEEERDTRWHLEPT